MHEKHFHARRKIHQPDTTTAALTKIQEQQGTNAVPLFSFKEITWWLAHLLIIRTNVECLGDDSCSVVGK